MAQARALIAQETVALDGTMALEWGELERSVIRDIRGLLLVRNDAGEVTLEIRLGDLLVRRDESDTRFGNATEAVFSGRFSISCRLGLAAGAEEIQYGSFSNGACKDAADAIGLWPLFPEQAP